MLSDGGMKVPYLRHGMDIELRFSTNIWSALRRTLCDPLGPWLTEVVGSKSQRVRRTADFRPGETDTPHVVIVP